MIVRSIRTLVAAALTALAAAGCAGSSRAVPASPATASTAVPAATGTARFSLVIPNRPAATSSARRAEYVRPTGFSANDTESALDSSGASGSQLAPISDQTYAVAGLANYGSVGLFTTGAAATTAPTCSTGFTRQPDMSIAANTVWTIQTGTVFTYDLAGCSGNPQFSGSTDVGVASRIVEIDPSCVANYQYPGVFTSSGSGAPAKCTGPHDVIALGNNKYAAIETNSSPHCDFVFAEKIGSSTFRLWQVTQPRISPAALNGFLPLPCGCTYANNTYISPATVTWSNRSMAIGADGYAYIAVTSPFNGVIVVDPVTMTRELPNAAVSALAPLNVVSDKRDTIYWSAGAYVMHYPSGASLS